MINLLKKYEKKEYILFLPEKELETKKIIYKKFKNIIEIHNEKEDIKIISLINNSKIKKIYLVGNEEIYHYILPRIKKEIEICWIFNYVFSSLSDIDIRHKLHCIFEFFDRGLVDTIGCVNEDNLKVFENAGYKCEFINLYSKIKPEKYKKSNTIGILSNDYDPNNNFYNQLAALTFVDYDYCKFKCVMGATHHFCEFFKIKNKKIDNYDEIIKDNFVNLYINFTNTNKELIEKSFQLGIPCIVGNTNIFDNNKYLKEHLVVKSDDDVNEIAEKIEFARNNREKIIEEYYK